MSFYVSTATFFVLHSDEWDRVVALPRHKFVTGATLLQLVSAMPPDLFVKYQKSKRQIREKKIDNCVTNNIHVVTSSVRNNSK